MWFVLDQIWPVRTITVMRRAVASVLQDAGRVITLIDSSLPPASYKKESNSLRDRLGKQLSTLRSLSEATEYEYGVEHDKYMQMGDKFMRISMTAVALVWNHTTLLHPADKSDSLNHPVLVALRHTIAQRLSSIADALSQQDVPDVPELPGTLDSEPLPREHHFEYTRNLIARYNELNALVYSLRTTT